MFLVRAHHWPNPKTWKSQDTIFNHAPQAAEWTQVDVWPTAQFAHDTPLAKFLTKQAAKDTDYPVLCML